MNEIILHKTEKTSIFRLLLGSNSIMNRSTCIFIHTATTQTLPTFFSEEEQRQLFKKLLSLLKSEEAPSAVDTIIHLIQQPNNLKDFYECLPIEEKLVLLDIILEHVRNNCYKATDRDFLPSDAVSFLSEKFKKRSDLILKTEDSYLDNVEPTEITVLLDIMGALTSSEMENFSFLKDDASLLINCICKCKTCNNFKIFSDS